MICWSPYRFIPLLIEAFLPMRRSLKAVIVIESEINRFWIGLIILLGPISFVVDE